MAAVWDMTGFFFHVSIQMTAEMRLIAARNWYQSITWGIIVQILNTVLKRR
jgi:hypothetical protein